MNNLIQAELFSVNTEGELTLTDIPFCDLPDDVVFDNDYKENLITGLKDSDDRTGRNSVSTYKTRTKIRI